jgi:hypothetical protein
MEILAFITFFAMGNTINNLEKEVATLGYFQEQNIKENLKHQEQINNLIIEVEELEQRWEQSVIDLAGAHSSSHARHETLHDMQQLQIDMMEMKQQEILEKMLAAGE